MKPNSLVSRFAGFTSVRRLLATSLFALLAVGTLPAQEQPPGPPPEADRGDRRERRNFDPEAIRDRMLNGLREQLEVQSDDEWAIIKERVIKVSELRRNSGNNPMVAMRAMSAGGGNSNRGRFFGGGAASPETTALVDAIKNHAPDGEIKARLEQLRSARKKEEAQLTQAQEDLRAVLNVRQEAIAVAAGLLP